ncbi:MAG: hypothetical protein EA001_15925 [Oscillatoriales cyanobacterium]|nr:MAG: hypothetical protein EA001_15925 [Oscillatoriales cyanobacterium]
MSSSRCPVCSTELSESETICPTCSWDSSPLPDSLGAGGSDRAMIALLRARDQVRLTWAREFWQRLNLDARLTQIEAYLKRARQERSHLYAELTQLRTDQQAIQPGELSAAIAALQALQAQLQNQLQNQLPAASGPGQSATTLPSDSNTIHTAPALSPADGFGASVDTNNPFHLPAHRTAPKEQPSAIGTATNALPNEEEVTVLQFTAPIPPAPTIDPYAKLAGLLADRKWLEADRETTQIMLSVSGRESSSWLRVEDIEQFPTRDLAEIDRLWVANSDGHFGFRTQNRIWQEVIHQTASPVEAWCRFGDRLGWNNQKTRNYSLSAPPGHLPYCSAVGVWWCSGLFPQIINQSLSAP